ncbi:MAG TPA: cyclic pyranopterin monophosphate synthase MoaC [Myxococcales bacterium]|nr:cyclic pyranopterin monophosphate synthase MoaC [Myxococcales bacterium]HAN30813.1 cyclic pyranopterin monophosphate synthase MoaC [Myxococcales bacterium]
MSSELSHVDASGKAIMVDVSGKSESQRSASAQVCIRMSPDAREALERHQGPKGDPVQVARVAAIMAVKRTAELIPMCHPLRLSEVAVDVHLESWGAKVLVRVQALERTGVEMEALHGASVAALTLFDMLKAVDPTMQIGDLYVLEKRGGRRGHYRASD